MEHTKKIGNIVMDLSYYKGSDIYSDGSIEDELLQMVSADDVDLLEAVKKDTRWPILYHLSPIRRNLLEWYNFPENGHVLEIGAGCGALTGLLSERSSNVTALELSLRRAEILANRHKDRNNIQVVVGDLYDIEFGQIFDCITVIGVLEYAGISGMDNPYETFLKRIKSILKPDGVLLLAIENKYGLKYWAGAAEDHSGIMFDGIQNYSSSNHLIRTFSKKELSEMLVRSGFQSMQYYYPVPDYKLPEEVYCDQYLPKPSQYYETSPNYDRKKMSLFNEKMAMSALIDNDMFPFFSNSYLVKCKL